MKHRIKNLNLAVGVNIRLPGLEYRDGIYEQHNAFVEFDDTKGVVTVERAHNGKFKRLLVPFSQCKYLEAYTEEEARGLPREPWAPKPPEAAA